MLIDSDLKRATTNSWIQYVISQIYHVRQRNYILHQIMKIRIGRYSHITDIKHRCERGKERGQIFREKMTVPGIAIKTKSFL